MKKDMRLEDETLAAFSFAVFRDIQQYVQTRIDEFDEQVMEEIQSEKECRNKG